MASVRLRCDSSASVKRRLTREPMSATNQEPMVEIDEEADEPATVGAADVETDDEATPLDGAAQADFYAAIEAMTAEEVEEPADLEFSTDSLQLFLKDIGRVDLLTAAQEVELAKRIERGDHGAKQDMVEAN